MPITRASSAADGEDESLSEPNPDRLARAEDPRLARPAAIAQTMLAGFDRHYALSRYIAQQAKSRFERGDWHGIRKLARDRIMFYDTRVREAVEQIRNEFGLGTSGKRLVDDRLWQNVKRLYVGLLANHGQPELAETFFNSVCCKILHRSYFHNDFIFVRPAVSTGYLESEPTSYRVYYPLSEGWGNAARRMIVDLGLACPFVDIERDLSLIAIAARKQLGPRFVPASDCQMQVLRSLFFRNKGAYLIGRFVNDGELLPFAVPILRDSKGRLYLDAILFGTERIEPLFNFARAYFMVDMPVPSGYVEFLSTLMPTKPESELYSMLGFHKQGKTLFYRDLLHHLKHSHDDFVIAPGIKGLVMLVFTLPSFPYVFKVIRDKRYKEVSAEFIRSQYQLVKSHDRVGRMADTWEYSGVPFPKDRVDPLLLAELRKYIPSLLEEEGDSVLVRHLYIERRMVPLNLYLESADDEQLEAAVIEYGDAIKDMVAANIFPGDMLYKNFGVTRHGRVVFYDYDEVAYLTDCNFRRIPLPQTPEDEMSAEPWYSVGPHDIFPEEFSTFLLGDPRIRRAFLKHHAELLEPEYWQARQRRIRDGKLDDVFPYPDSLRLRHRLAPRPAPRMPSAALDA